MISSRNMSFTGREREDTSQARNIFETFGLTFKRRWSTGYVQMPNSVRWQSMGAILAV